MDLNAVLTAVGGVVDRQGADLLKYLLILTGVGTLAMAIVEMAKSVGKGAQRFNKWRVSSWTKELADMVAPEKEHPIMDRNAVLDELHVLAVGAHSDANALYDQPIEKMMGQIQAAVNLALEFPEEYPYLYAFITSVPREYERGKAYVVARQDSDRWQSGARLVHNIRALAPGTEPLAEDVSAAQEATKSRARLNNLVARKLDAFQNQTQYQWARLNQWSATALSVVIFLFAFAWGQNYAVWIQAVVLALPAGVIAPFAKQLAGSLSSFGK